MQTNAPAIVLVLALTACAPSDPTADAACGTEDALVTCLEPTLPAQHYIDASLAYFDTMDRRVTEPAWPDYSERVVRWEWPPWLLLTAYTRANIEAADTLLRLYPSIVEERDCRFFDTQPFGRCRIVFYYDAEEHQGRPCPIYEEFAFNDEGQITWIEAWSDLDGYRPMDPDTDPWAEGEIANRLSTRVPGLGTPSGLIDPQSPAMIEAAARDPDVAQLVTRSQDWLGTWSAELEAAGDDLWPEGCGWNASR